MIYHLSLLLRNYFSGFNVIHYVSFRALAALLTALVLSFVGGQRFIEWSGQFFRSKSREWTPANHRIKDNMPTMGGLFILLVVFITCLLWSDLSSYGLWIFFLCLLGFAGIGFIDDWQKIKRSKGISARRKFLFQIMMAAFIAIMLNMNGLSTSISFPFFKSMNPNLGVFFIVWAILVIVGTSNAVNLTDGLDGLAINSLIPNFATFSIIAYLAGHYQLAHYLHIPFANSSEMSVIGGALVGSSLGFLWYNTYPAQIFMGDVGSLALGSGLGLIALISKQEMLLLISGGLFVIETLSVIIQIVSYRLFGKRIFKMAPIHHHFELMGWQESKITVRFGIISLILCLLSLMILKIR